MLYKDNPIINYKKEKINVMSILIKSVLFIIFFAILLGFIFYKPFIAVNNKAFDLASDKQLVKKRIDMLDDRSKKINKGDNYFIYNESFFWNPNVRSIDNSDGYHQKFANIIMNYNRNNGAITVTIKKVPDISCDAFAAYVKEKHGNLIIRDDKGLESSCPFKISTLFTSHKYDFEYVLKP